MRRSLIVAFVGAVIIAVGGIGQVLHAKRAQKLNAPAPPPACCMVTTPDSRTGIVAARESATGRTFEFRVTDTTVLSKLRPGSPVYANFNAKLVSLDGKTACCQIIGAPQAAAPANAPHNPPPSQPNSSAPPAAAKSAPLRATAVVPQTQLPSRPNPCAGQNEPSKQSPASNVLHQVGTPTGSFGASICAGTPYQRRFVMTRPTLRFDQRTVTASGQGVTASAPILHIRGLDGIQQAQAQNLIPKTVADILAMHVRALPAGQSDHYMVNPQLALEWSRTHPEPSLAEGTATDNHEGCNKWSMHCVGEVVEHAEGQVDQMRAEAQQKWQAMIQEASKKWGEPMQQFNESYRTLGKVPIAFSQPFQFTVPLKYSASSGGFSGQVDGSASVGFPVSMNMTADVSVFYVEAFPFLIRPRSVDGEGSMTTGTTMSAAVTATGKFQQTFLVFKTTPRPIPIEVLPIIAGGVPIAEVDISAYIEANVNVNATAEVDASYEVDHTHTINFRFSCDGGGCGTPTETQEPTQTTTTKKAEIKGQATITPMVYTALQFDFDFDALSVRAGPQPALIGQINGCAYSSSKTVTGGGANVHSVQGSQALTADLDWKTDFLSQASIADKTLFTHTNSLVGRRHILFEDLMKGGSSALMAGVTEAANPATGQPVLFKVQMPQCYPYTDRIQYQVVWTGGASGVPTTPAQGNASSCTWGAGQGMCFGDPNKELDIAFNWPTAGSYSVTVVPIHDTHPRDFKVTPKPVAVNVQGRAAAASSGAAPLPKNP